MCVWFFHVLRVLFGETIARTSRCSHALLIAASAVSLALPACDGTSVPRYTPTALTSPAPTTRPAATPTAARLEFDDPFDRDRGYWEIFHGAQIAQGAFVLGPFETWNFTLCLACGYLADYDVRAEAAFDSGVSERGFGLLLRFVDENGDGLPDLEDYFLDFEINVYYQSVSVFEKKAGERDYTRLVTHYAPGVAPGRQVNLLRAVSTEGGSVIALYVNESLVETLADRPAVAGQIGFVVGDGGLAVRFDNFAIHAPP